MSRTQLAKLLGVSRATLINWEKEKPNLIKLINQGLLYDQHVKEMEQYLEKLKSLQKETGGSKLINKRKMAGSVVPSA